MLAEEKRLQAEIDELLKQAQVADDAEDAELGREHRGDELPDELSRRESRLLKIREAKAALEQQARDKAAAEAAIREAEGKPSAKIDPQDAVPDPKAQRNFTDPESKIMKTSSKGWDQCGNAQAVVNENQIIIAADVTDQANDVRQVQPMLDQTITNINQAGVTENIKAFTADAGCCGEANVEALEDHERVDGGHETIRSPRRSIGRTLSTVSLRLFRRCRRVIPRLPRIRSSMKCFERKTSDWVLADTARYSL